MNKNLQTLPMVVPPPRLYFKQDDIWHSHRSIIPLLTKSHLRSHFNCSGKMLSKHIFTDQVLKQIGITRKEYRKINTAFPTEIKDKIFDVLKIEFLRVL